MRKIPPHISLIMTIIVGVLFIVSAVLKLKSLDSFELYIFSFEMVSLNIASLLSRIIIGVEFSLGVAYLLNIYHKRVFYAILASTLAFTLFLIVVTLLGREDNCHCFGSLVDISPIESILKNIAIIAAIILSYNLPEWRSDMMHRVKSYILLLLCAVALYPTMKYPPRGIADLLYGKRGDNQINIELFNGFLNNNPQYRWGEETKIMIFYGTDCKYCKRSATLLSNIIRRNSLDSNLVSFIFWGTEQSVNNFYKQTRSVDIGYKIIPPAELFGIVNGTIPTIIYYDEEAEENFTTRNIHTIDEAELIEILKR